jgi:hypothetical protein
MNRYIGEGSGVTRRLVSLSTSCCRGLDTSSSISSRDSPLVSGSCELDIEQKQFPMVATSGSQVMEPLELTANTVKRTANTDVQATRIHANAGEVASTTLHKLWLVATAVIQNPETPTAVPIPRHCPNASKLNQRPELHSRQNRAHLRRQDF